MKILVTGGRGYNDAAYLFWILDKIHAKRTIDLIIEGGATGADRLARAWAIRSSVLYQPYPANWERYGLRAGHVRNHAMLRESKPDVVVAFKGGKGTAHMVRIAKEAGVRVFETYLPRT